jgi:3-hydroxyacyl-CoA dehydrogenase
VSSPVSLSWRGAVALITVDNPPVNAINHAVRVGLLAALDDIAKNKSAKAVVIAAAGKTFMAGSDIKEFDAPPRAPGLPEVIDKIEMFPLPVVAAIHGTALGGGFEIALGCHARIAASNAKVGLPEIHLGIIPGAGGTQRLPRLIGAEKALDWILTGRHVPAAEAVDETVESDLIQAAVAFAEKATIKRTRDLSAQVDAAVLDAQRKAVAKRARGFEAPPAAIDAVVASAKPFEEGMRIESEISARLKVSDQSRAQRHLFFAEREVARIPDIPKETPLRPVVTVGVVGAGTMGRGIVVACLNAGMKVVWVDRADDLVARGVEAVRGIYARDVEKKRLTEAALAERMSRLSPSSNAGSVSDADLVIEAAFEDMAVKQELFRQFDRVCKPGAVLASNTSTLDVNQIADVTSRPGDVVGMHFFSPAHVMKLLEVVRGAASAPDAVATAMSFGKRIGKTAVLSGVCFGFIGNRMFEGYIRESQMLLLEGATPAQVDRALTDFGMAMGPCAVIDLAGVDVSYLTREGNRAKLPKDPRYCAIGDALHHLGRHGQKTGKGFYRYAEGKTLDDPEVEALIRAEAQRLGVKQRAISTEEIVARCMYPLIDEGLRILDERIALRASDIDVVWTSGYGFPRYRGGPMFHADLIGLKVVADCMTRFASELGNEFGYWTPAPLLATLVKENKKISEWMKV